MDRRLAERRRKVAEDRARSNLGRLVRLLLVVAVLAALIWYAQSPFLSVGEIEVRGAEHADVERALDAHDVVERRPMLLLDIDGARETLSRDPWVAEVTVVRDWPTRVVIEIVERTPAAALQLAGEWWLAAADGTLLQVAPDRPDLATAVFPELEPSEAAEDLSVKGAVEFLAALPADYQSGATRVGPGPEGLEATVAGFTVRLGRPFDMSEKAAVTAAMINSGLEEGSIVTVVAPANPAVLPPPEE